jgi:3-phosphoshikimate 1-carboxyvinyltransferase
MHILVTPTPLKGDVFIISSKSLSHRYIIAAALSKGVSYIQNVMESDDLYATKKALESLNASFNNDIIEGQALRVINPNIECMASGSTVRFLIPIAMLLDEKIRFHGKDHLPKRPLDIYEHLFKSKGLHYERLSLDHLPIEVKGPLQGGIYELRGDVSSQFVSGLLFALPLCNKDSEIKIIGELESKPYVMLTVRVLEQFGINIHTTDHGFIIPGNQAYQPTSARVEGDFSQAAFFIIAGLIGHQIQIHGLNPKSLQGDAKIIDIITSMNGKIGYIDNVLEVKPSFNNKHHNRS